MKYRKKPVIIDAWFFKDQWSEKPEWLIEARDHGEAEFGYREIFIKTLEGTMKACCGEDYIIRGVHGEIYPCKKDIFEEIYEPVEEPCIASSSMPVASTTSHTIICLSKEQVNEILRYSR